MSILLRSVLRDPIVTRPLSRALRRTFDDDFWHDDWPVKRVRRLMPSEVHESPLATMEDMNRQMVSAMNRMQEFAENLDSMLYGSGEPHSSAASEEVQRIAKKTRKERPPQSVVRRTETGGLQLALDVAGFKPEELKIKLIDDNLVVEAVSEQSGQDSYQKSHFKRWFKLPEDCKLDEIKSKLTEDRRLLIDLPSNRPELEQKAKTIPIEMEKPQVKQSEGGSTQLNGDGNTNTEQVAQNSSRSS